MELLKTPDDVMSLETLRDSQGKKLKVKKTQAHVGASPFFDHDIYELDTIKKKQRFAVSNDKKVRNQLKKQDLLHEDKILERITSFAGKPAYVWMSNTLAQDLNLPMSTVLQPRRKVIQALVLCVDHPPFILMLYNKRKNAKYLEKYNRDTARLLHWSLLNFCHVDFTVLPCKLNISFAKMFTLKGLQKEVLARRSEVKKYFKSPLDLNEEKVGQLEAATTALVGATFVPSLLEGSSADTMWLFLMDEELRDEVSQQIELLNKKDKSKACSSLEVELLDPKVIAVLEAAKRVSFTRQVVVTGMTSDVQNCMRKLEDYTKNCFGILLKLSTEGVKTECIINLKCSDDWQRISRTPVSQTPRSGRKRAKTDVDVVRNVQPRLRTSPIRTQ